MGSMLGASVSLSFCHRVRGVDDNGVRSPGRFFAANELKAMLAFMVVNYDLKLAGDGARPANVFFGSSVVPAPSGQLMFRKRQPA